MKIRTDQVLVSDPIKMSQVVAKFWDQISEVWRKIWGPHIHHGFYENNETLEPLEAQEKLIIKLTELLSIKPETQILDVGCGMGGSSIFLAKRYQAIMQGVTLSPKQVLIASKQAELEQVSNVSFKVENALSLSSFADNTFDIVWSLESCEQFFDKDLFIKQAFRVLKPGGQLMLATWCSDQEVYEGKLAMKYSQLCQAFDLPYMPTINYYAERITANHFTLNKNLDWTANVAKSWDIGVTLTNAYSFLQIFKLAGLRGLRFARQIKMMQEAFHMDRVRYGVFVATK